jgi:rRNA processing protein Krr1/Pno1
LAFQNFPEGQPRRVTVSGTPESVDSALALLNELLYPPAQAAGGSNGGGGGGGGAEFSLDIEAHMVGKIIGRGGETIRSLQQNSGARITIDQNFPAGHPRKIHISGSPDVVERAKHMVNDVLSAPTTGGRPGPQQGGPQIVLDIQKGIVGKLIGRGGETIKGLQQATGARVQIDQNALKVTISGNQAAVDQAHSIVTSIIDGGEVPDFRQVAAFGAAAGGGGGGGGGWGQQPAAAGYAYDPYAYHQVCCCFYSRTTFPLLLFFDYFLLLPNNAMTFLFCFFCILQYQAAAAWQGYGAGATAYPGYDAQQAYAQQAGAQGAPSSQTEVPPGTESKSAASSPWQVS